MGLRDPNKRPRESVVELTMNGTGRHLEGGRFVELRVIDPSSGRLVFEAHLTGAEVVGALAGSYLSDVPCRWYDTERIGWVRETVTCEVTYNPSPWEGRKERARAAVEKVRERLEAENPGCIVEARLDDATNHHRATLRDQNTTAADVVFWITRPPEDG